MIRRTFLLASAGSLAGPGAAAAAVARDVPPSHPRIRALVADSGFSGVVRVLSGDRALHAQSAGLANVEFGVPNGPDTRYWVASITKAVTSVLVLQMVDQGRIALDAPIAAYLPDYRGDAARKVTIHQLLNHTSGMENIDRIPNIEDVQEGIRAATEAARTDGVLPLYQTPYDSDQLLDLFCSRPLANTPGRAFDYNNADYIVLGKILERLHGQPFGTILERSILTPLGLSGAGLLRQEEVIARLAARYSPTPDGRLAHDMPVYPENWYAAGAMYATIDDAQTFSSALFGGRLLKAETLERMITPGLDDYGYGVWSRQMQAAGRSWRVVTRPGRIMGARAQLLHLPEADLTVIALANTGRADLDDLSHAIARTALAERS